MATVWRSWLSLHCFIWRCFRGSASFRCTTATGLQVELGLVPCLQEEWLGLWWVAPPLGQSAAWWCCSLVHLSLAPVETELLTCTELRGIWGSQPYPRSSQMVVWVTVSIPLFSVLKNFGYFSFSYLKTLQNRVVSLCFGTVLPMQTCLRWLMRLCARWFVPPASVWTRQPVPSRGEGDAAALKHPRAYSLLV